MATEKGTTTDFVGGRPTSGPTDTAIHAVRSFQRAESGVTVSHAAAALKALTDDQLLYVSLATRVPVRQLKALQSA